MQSDAKLARDAERLLALVHEMGRLNTLRDPVSVATAELHFSPPQIHALLWLSADGPMPMAQLAQRVAVTDKTITGLADRLERAGLVQRERSAEDRRVVRLALTAAGKKSARSLELGIQRKTRWFLSLLSEADRRALLRITEAVALRIRELARPTKETSR